MGVWAPSPRCDSLPALIPALRYLEWDSQFFGCRIASMTAVRTPADLEAVEGLNLPQPIDCTYLLCEAHNQSLLVAAIARGFVPVDIRVSLERAVFPEPAARPASTDILIRQARSTDLPSLKLLASQLHRDSRFYTDTHFAHELCDALYARWIERDVENPQCHVWVPQSKEALVGGYASLTAGGDKQGTIGLFGLQESFRSKGVASCLIQTLLSDAAQQGLQRVHVVTQGRNVPAQRFYQKHGFRTSSVQLWLHRWSTPSPP